MISAGSHLLCRVVSAGSKRSRTVSVEAKYDGQSPQEAKTSRLVYTLCSLISYVLFGSAELSSCHTLLQWLAFVQYNIQSTLNISKLKFNCYLKQLLSQSKFSGPRKFTLR